MSLIGSRQEVVPTLVSLLNIGEREREMQETDKGTGDHVDILGRASLNDLILRIAGGKGDEINETIHSNITQYAEKVKIWDD
jgi:phospholipid:diacylglycerol acyltransferase